MTEKYVVTKVKYDDGWRFAVVEYQMAIDWPSVQQTRDTEISPPDRDKPREFAVVEEVETKEEAYSNWNIWEDQ